MILEAGHLMQIESICLDLGYQDTIRCRPFQKAFLYEGFDKKHLISCNYGKEISQIPESKTGKE